MPGFTHPYTGKAKLDLVFNPKDEHLFFFRFTFYSINTRSAELKAFSCNSVFNIALSVMILTFVFAGCLNEQISII